MTPEINLLINDIDTFLKERFKYKTDCCNFIFNKIDIKRAAITCEIRVSRFHAYFPKNTLVFSLIDIRDTRKGTFDSLLKMICKNRNKHGFEYIGLEQCCSVHSINFAKKHNFIEMNEYSSDDVKNFYIKCEEYF